MTYDLGRGRDGSRSRALVDQGYLAEVVASPQRPDPFAADRHRRFPGLDDEEGGGPYTFLDDRLSGGEFALFEHAGDLRYVALTQAGEKRNLLDNFGCSCRRRDARA